jgi:hypothetical protein
VHGWCAAAVLASAGCISPRCRRRDCRPPPPPPLQPLPPMPPLPLPPLTPPLAPADATAAAAAATARQEVALCAAARGRVGARQPGRRCGHPPRPGVAAAGGGGGSRRTGHHLPARRCGEQARAVVWPQDCVVHPIFTRPPGSTSTSGTYTSSSLYFIGAAVGGGGAPRRAGHRVPARRGGESPLLLSRLRCAAAFTHATCARAADGADHAWPPLPRHSGTRLSCAHRFDTG